MRQNNYRGKTLDNNKWVYGYLIELPLNTSGEVNYAKFIYCPLKDKYYEVIEESIGQYTGITNSDGNGIYEGDIVLSRNTFNNLVVVWGEDECGFSLRNTNNKDWDSSEHFFDGRYESSPFDWNVLGNYFDNPDLLNREEW
jgi:hypothetical protein